MKKNPLTPGLSALWSSATAVARWSARKGILRSQRLPTRVISVGNLQSGGAGKTPLVAQIAREAIDRKLDVAILTRGYRGKWERRGGLIRPRLAGQADAVALDPAQCGDEAALLHDLVPEAWIGVGADRIAQFKKIPCAVHLVVLDDGFQHWKIQKNLEIVALTSAQADEVVFRDFESALSAADLLVWTKGEPGPITAHLPQVRTCFELKPAEVDGQTIVLVSGVADGQSVAHAVTRAQYRIAAHFEFPDHYSYTRRDIDRVQEQARQLGCPIALTGKDWVKWRALLKLQSSAEFLVLEPELRFVEGREHWERMLWG